MSMKLSNLAFVLVLLIAEASFATKCFVAKTPGEFQVSFPVVIRGKVIGRLFDKNKSGSFELRILVVEALKGEVHQSKILTASGQNSGRAKKHVYNDGAIYVFPGILSKKNEIRILLPEDGCPALPRD